MGERVDERQLRFFVRESNRIEGILRSPLKRELGATELFLALRAPRILDLEGLVSSLQPDARLRDGGHLNVRVGNHIAPRGGAAVVERLAELLAAMPTGDPWTLHCAYEHLHPFTDGNGRSGRAIWAWMMTRRQEGLPLGFLHHWYYQTLSAEHMRRTAMVPFSPALSTPGGGPMADPITKEAEPCLRCGGDGFLVWHRWLVSAGKPLQERCPTCSGSGVIEPAPEEKTNG